MTEFELRSLIYKEISVASSNFEFWLNGPLAALVAGCSAFSRLSPELRRAAH